MTLADELRGVKPRITVTGRVVIQPDEDTEAFMPDIPRRTALREWVKTAGRFTSFDAAEAVGIDRYNASQYLTDFQRGGLILKVGELPGTTGRKAFVYEPAPDDPVARANRKHFGA